MILPITNKVGDFTNGEKVTGQTSGAAGIAVTKNEPVSLLCRGQVNPSNVFEPYFSAKYYHYEDHDPSNEICLNSVQGTFSHGEQVVGGTSGATATVEEWQDYTLSRETGNDMICRHTGDEPSYAEAKAIYVGSPTWDISDYPPDEDLMVQWAAGHPGVYYNIWARNAYVSFNTTAISLVKTAQILFQHIACPYLYECPTVLYIYKHDFGDTLEIGDWTGGILIAQRTFTYADNGQDITIDIDPADVTPGGHSRFRFALKRMVNLEYWPEEDLSVIHHFYAEYVKLKLSAI